MSWSKDIINFLSIPKVSEWIDQDKMDDLYEFAHIVGQHIIGELTSALLAIGYNPLKHLDTVPVNFGFNSTFTTIDIPSNIISLELEAFKKCKNLKELELPDTITYIGSNVFEQCPELHTIKLSNNLKQLPRFTFFNNSKLTNIHLPKSLIAIQSKCFYQCASLRNITLPSSLTNIGGTAFAYSGLESIVIPQSVLTIGTECFYNCTNLKFIMFEGDPIIQTNIFEGVPPKLKIEVPKDSQISKLLQKHTEYEIIEK